MFKSNEYFDGKVKSLAFQTSDKPATIGVMAAGEYTFSTEAPETVTVISGGLIITLPGSDTAQRFAVDESFHVPGTSSFGVRVPMDSACLCLYG